MISCIIPASPLRYLAGKTARLNKEPSLCLCSIPNFQCFSRKTVLQIKTNNLRHHDKEPRSLHLVPVNSATAYIPILAIFSWTAVYIKQSNHQCLPSIQQVEFSWLKFHWWNEDYCKTFPEYHVGTLNIVKYIASGLIIVWNVKTMNYCVKSTLTFFHSREGVSDMHSCLILKSQVLKMYRRARKPDNRTELTNGINCHVY